MATREFTVRIPDERVLPDSVPLPHLIRLLREVDQLIGAYDLDRAYGGEEAEELEDQRGYVSLVWVRSGSSTYGLAVSDPYADFLPEVFSAVSRRDYADVPLGAQHALARIGNLATKFEWSVEFREQFTHTGTGFTIQPGEKLGVSEEPLIVRGTTTLTGEVVMAGGVKPSAKIRPIGGGRLVVVRMGADMAKEMAQKLYSTVTIRGEAHWNSSNQELLGFEGRELVPHEAISIGAAFRALADATDGARSIPDPVEFVKRSRES